MSEKVKVWKFIRPGGNFDPRHSSQNEKGRCYSFAKFLIIQDEKFN